jgi:hypothetical protein
VNQNNWFFIISWLSQIFFYSSRRLINIHVKVVCSFGQFSSSVNKSDAVHLDHPPQWRFCMNAGLGTWLSSRTAVQQGWGGMCSSPQCCTTKNQIQWSQRGDGGTLHQALCFSALHA